MVMATQFLAAVAGATLMQPVIKQRQVDQAAYQTLIGEGIEPILAQIIAARPVPTQHKKSVLGVVDPKLADLDHPSLMQDMDKAVARLIQALQNQEVIAIETDHDCDGQTSHAVIHTCLLDSFGHPQDKVQSYIGHRMKEGYGLSDSVAQRILAANPRPTLVITADNGSSDEARIALLKQAGIDVIVTDHHHLPEDGPPVNAYAVLNPTRADCDFPDPYIAGCMVAWLFMAATRGQLIAKGLLPKAAMPMTEVLDFVAVGTVADCVSMARSVNNRAVVRYGLRKIEQAQRPCWQALLPLLKNAQVTAQDLGFTVGPLLNSDGRLSDAFGAVNFLLAETLAEATPWAQKLWESNQQRKDIQQGLTKEAMQQAVVQVAQEKQSIVVAFAEGHAGVHGISASRIKDHFGRPTILFSVKENEPDVLSGSARSVDCIHMRDALQKVATQLPDVVLSFGGHAGAAGIKIISAHLTAFTEAFEQAVLALLAGDTLQPECWTDGELPSEHLSLLTYDLLQTLDPFGREFDVPVFEFTGTLISLRRVGQDQTHAQVVVQLPDRRRQKGIWFNCCESAEDDLPVMVGDQVHVIASLGDNVYQNQRTLQLVVRVLFSI